MTAAIAALPLLAVLGLMIGLRWRAAFAGLAGLVVASLLAVWLFGLGTTTLAKIGPAGAIGGALLEAAFAATTILWIIFPALVL